jgi:hypothetical protein
VALFPFAASYESRGHALLREAMHRERRWLTPHASVGFAVADFRFRRGIGGVPRQCMHATAVQCLALRMTADPAFEPTNSA